ncbi:WD40-repeat-containing domain protein [Phakopsora pachyrhizi]|uniref:WD40-repeat-containing domain protein n=1 Tax=Phakopsora pachyrhizi TaxID=170000 RepID=A0AAV0B430_PHAPC|nr:WD40-repeat-containing domain protein [Phakopsora pachyrhizi]
MGAGKEFELFNLDDAISALRFHPELPGLLLSSSWDRSARLFDLDRSGEASEPLGLYHHPSAILDLCFGSDRCHGKAYTASLDHGVREIDLELSSSTSTTTPTNSASSRPNRVISTHQDAVKCIHYSKNHNILISGSWDRSIVLQDPNVTSNKQFPGAITTLMLPNLPSKVYCLDCSEDKLVVAMGNRKTWIWDLRMLSEAVQRVNDQSNSAKNPMTGQEPVIPPPPFLEKESSLKFMTRSIKCMPNGSGYASSSIEGRIAVEFFDQSPEVQSKKYAFKCHRQTVDGVDLIYPVHALAFHPELGTFASGGGDGIVSIWDSKAKKRLRQLPAYPGSISSLDFNVDGTRLAIGVSVFEEEGMTNQKSVVKDEKEDKDEQMDGGEGDEKKRKAKKEEEKSLSRNVIFVRTVNDDCKVSHKFLLFSNQ